MQADACKWYRDGVKSGFGERTVLNRVFDYVSHLLVFLDSINHLSQILEILEKIAKLGSDGDVEILVAGNADHIFWFGITVAQHKNGSYVCTEPDAKLPAIEVDYGVAHTGEIVPKVVHLGSEIVSSDHEEIAGVGFSIPAQVSLSRDLCVSVLETGTVGTVVGKEGRCQGGGR